MYKSVALPARVTRPPAPMSRTICPFCAVHAEFCSEPKQPFGQLAPTAAASFESMRLPSEPTVMLPVAPVHAAVLNVFRGAYTFAKQLAGAMPTSRMDSKQLMYPSAAYAMETIERRVRIVKIRSMVFFK